MEGRQFGQVAGFDRDGCCAMLPVTDARFTRQSRHKRSTSVDGLGKTENYNERTAQITKDNAEKKRIRPQDLSLFVPLGISAALADDRKQGKRLPRNVYLKVSSVGVLAAGEVAGGFDAGILCPRVLAALPQTVPSVYVV